MKKKMKIYEFRIFLPLQNSRLQLSLQESLVDEFMVRAEKSGDHASRGRDLFRVDLGIIPGLGIILGPGSFQCNTNNSALRTTHYQLCDMVSTLHMRTAISLLMSASEDEAAVRGCHCPGAHE